MHYWGEAMVLVAAVGVEAAMIGAARGAVGLERVV